MSNKVQNPNQGGSKAFLWALVAVVVVAIAVVAYIVINGQGAKTEFVAEREYENISISATLDEDKVTLEAEDGAAADADVVQLYEDFSCSYCALLAENTDDDMRADIESGDLVVEVYSLNFLDRGNAEGHSTRSLAAILAVVDSGDSDLYWNYRTLLLEEQDNVINQWTDDDFADAAAHMGAESSVVDAIRNGDNIEQAVEVATGNAELLNEQTGSVSSPRVLQDGQDLPVDDINQWIEYLRAQRA